MTTTVLSPIGLEPTDVPIEPVARLGSLKGIRLGLLDNSKQNAGVLLQSVAERLAQAYGLEVQAWSKGAPNGAAGPVAESIATEMASSVDAALVAIGD